MSRTLLLGVLAFAAFHCYGALQLQMPEAGELQMEDDLQTQVKELQKNVSDVWTYIYELRNAVSGHLTHLRQHQEELEISMHRMEHLHESELHSSGHHHSGEDHSHGADHSHGDDHSHGSDSHSHGSMQDHSHSGEHHSHSNEHHSHSGEHGGHHSHSSSHSSHDDSHSHGGDDHHHHHDHKDSHETEDLSQQTQKVSEVGQIPVAEPIVVPANRQEHYHHSHSHSHSSRTNSAGGMDLMNFHSHHHHHDGEAGGSSRNRSVELPRFSDYGQYDIALCRMEPNKALTDDQRQDITGTVTLWQKKTGTGPLNIHVSVRGFDVGDHHAHHQQTIQTEQDNETPQAVGHRHGFHIHASGDLSNGCQSTGPHYNPKGVNHGGPHSLVRHVGDLGNIECDEHGVTNIMFSDDVASLRGQYSVAGKAIVIHALEDDLGQGNDAESLKTGNAGTRLACCVIQKVDKIPIRHYKAMKLATQYQNR